MQRSRFTSCAVILAIGVLIAGCGESTNPAGPRQLGITIEQLSVNAGANLSIAVAIQDASGNIVSASTSPVTLALGTNPGGATLEGDLTVNAVNGVATFTGVHITSAGQGYTIVASSQGLTAATSDAFEIVAGPAAGIGFLTPPSNVAAGQPFSPVIQVVVQDQYGNAVTTAVGGITLALASNPGGGTLSGTLTAALSSGIATFPGVSINKAAQSYTLSATATPASFTVTSSAFAVSGGAAAKLAFEPMGASYESAAFIGNPVRVRILDADGNSATAASNSVTLAIANNAGSGTLTALSGALTRGVTDGQADFGDVSIDKVGTGYTLLATSPGLESATSMAFAITPGFPSQISWFDQPATEVDAGIMLPAFRIALLDAAGNVVDDRVGYFVHLTVGSGPAGGKIVAFGGEGRAVLEGFADFTSIRFDRPGTYTIRATSAAMVVDSDPVTVRPLAFSKATVGGGPAFSFPITQARHTCGLTTAGVAFCWGGSIWGAMGIETNDATANALLPELVATNQLFKDVDAGNIHTCAVTLTGAAFCWGSNLHGRLGDGDPQQGTKATPVPVSGGLHFVSISAGDTHTCGVTSSGAGASSGPAYCWGSNSSGQLGDGTFDERNVPALVSGGLSFIAVSASHGAHTCGITTDFLTYCWGLNLDGQLGDNSTTNRSEPTLVQDAATHLFRHVSTGRFHTCAVKADNATWCWGANTSQQLGDGNTDQTDRIVPSLSGAAITAVSAGWLHTCGIGVGGGALCWGANDGGQLGDGGTTERNASAPVSGSLGITQVAAAEDFSCGVTSDNRLYCWGKNDFGQLGDGTTSQRLTPVRVLP
jgi:alpha-tubulin suppressor-like RCC1 family protein